MTGVTDDVLAKIDGALTGYGYVEPDDDDGMRWRPEEPDASEADEGAFGGGDDIPLRPGLTVAVHFRSARYGWNLCVRAEARSARQMPGLEKDMSAHYGREPGLHPRPASHCDDCNPRGNPGPLAVDGRAYQKRLKSRRKRR